MSKALAVACHRHLAINAQHIGLTDVEQDRLIERDSMDGILDLLEEQPDISVVITCLRAGDMHGLYLIQTLRARFPGVVVFTLFDVSPSMEMARRTVAGLIHAHVALEGSPGSQSEPQRCDPERLGYHLTERQRHVLYLLRAGLANKQVARALELSEGTVKIHCMALFRELNVQNRTQAAIVADRLLLDEPPLVGPESIPGPGSLQNPMVGGAIRSSAD